MWIDVVILGLFVAYAVGSGFWNQRKASRSLQEYFLAGRTLPGWKSGCSMTATQFAADTPLLVTGLIAAGGVFFLWRLWIYGIAFLLMAFLFAVCWRRSGVLTDAELTAVRYSGRGVDWLRGLKSIYYGTLINCVVMAMVLVAALRIAEIFLPWHTWLAGEWYDSMRTLVEWSGIRFADSLTGLAPGVLATDQLITIVVLFGFTTLYSTTGGLRSVVATDVLQLVLALGGTALYAWVLVDALGGLEAMGSRLVESYGAVQAAEFYRFIPPPEELAFGFFMLIGLQWLFQMNSDGTGYLAQRSMACRSEADATRAGVLFAWLQIVVRSAIWVVIALALLALYPFGVEAVDGEQFVAMREMTFVEGIRDELSPGARGLMLVALLAALASTLDTHLNWGASYWSNDLYGAIWCRRFRKRKPDPKMSVLMARFSNVLLVVISLVVVTNLGSIQEAWMVSLLFGAGMGGVLVLRWVWERINLSSELAAMGVSLVAAPLLLMQGHWEEWQRLGTMALLSTGAAVVAALVGPQTDPERLRAFYRKVRPPGFWGKTAAAVGEAPDTPRQLLWRGCARTGAAALSLYGALIGVVKLLVPAPGESWWVGLLFLVLSALLLPLWWRNP